MASKGRQTPELSGDLSRNPKVEVTINHVTSRSRPFGLSDGSRGPPLSQLPPHVVNLVFHNHLEVGEAASSDIHALAKNYCRWTIGVHVPILCTCQARSIGKDDDATVTAALERSVFTLIVVIPALDRLGGKNRVPNKALELSG